ncbi:putative reverse transcriptase-Group II intron [Burkholderia contaminans]|uniref:reverse transcriptase domain-containing protein n=1 Tax=Burkholderia contaminans TaxID=488447 RepID=UPI001453F0A0|nr:reverse transcriptase domain-containing protein [Burkholderia contaminans]VWD37369.1 putative reverse transcriptase-Group II intron [Burkholderia contaminans]
MSVERQLVECITRECDKLILRHQNYHNNLHLEWLRNKRRIADAPPKIIKEPESWSLDRKFNPFYVKSKVKAIAKSISRKIEAGLYTPEAPHHKTIPKANGGTRELTIYQIPDAAVSRYFYERLLAKNRHRFSSFSYAYRNDRNVHFAIQDIAIDLSEDARTFIAEFDFSDFFGSINHNYLYNQFDANGFLISEQEKGVIRAFLSTREKGIPQGTSISLFLANLVCWRLDKSLEKEGLKFARYADDTVIWSPDYASICRSFSLISNFSHDVGVAINTKKSAGISLLAKDGFRSEIVSKSDFDFLGYSIGVGRVSIRDKTEARIKKQISYLLYRNLIQPLKDFPLRGLIIPSNNRDRSLLVAMTQIRRYLYGGLLHRDLIEYISGRKKNLYFKGVMSFYPLLNDEAQLRRLDGWLTSTIHRSVKLRSALLLGHRHDRRHSFPFNVSRRNLTKEFRKQRIDGKRLLEVPSFMLIYQALQRGLLESGIEKIMHPESVKYDYSNP